MPSPNLAPDPLAALLDIETHLLAHLDQLEELHRLCPHMDEAALEAADRPVRYQTVVSTCWRQMRHLLRGADGSLPPEPIVSSAPEARNAIGQAMDLVRAKVRAAQAEAPAVVDETLPARSGNGEDSAADDEPLKQFVRLDQIAALLKRSKKTLERMKSRQENPLPCPDIEGGGGKADEWDWARIRPWLEAEFQRKLPESFPSWCPSG